MAKARGQVVGEGEKERSGENCVEVQVHEYVCGSSVGLHLAPHSFLLRVASLFLVVEPGALSSFVAPNVCGIFLGSANLCNTIVISKLETSCLHSLVVTLRLRVLDGLGKTLLTRDA